MYPGTDEAPGLRVEFAPGMTLVMGANGLGKTTLITMLFRLLTGPFDIQSPSDRGAWGTRRVESTRLPSWEASTFAARVTDGASGATAELTFSIGNDRFVVVRELSQLRLVSAQKNGRPLDPEEVSFQQEIIDAAQVAAFGEWILLLRLLVFYFEDRRALVWDRSAQVQLLRLLFLSPEASQGWAQQFRDILELDSLVRNLNYAINKEERLVAKTETAIGRLPEVRQQLALLSEIQDREQDLLEGLNDQLVALTGEREEARLMALRAEQATETAARSLERLELRAVEAAFPSGSETVKYIVAQILSDNTCLTCETVVPEFATGLRDRVREGACPVCSSRFPARSSEPIPARQLADAQGALQIAIEGASAAVERRNRAEANYEELLDRVQELTAATATRDRAIGELVRQLPPDQATVQERRHGLNADKGRLAAHRARLARLRADFEATQAGVNAVIAESAEEVKAAFDAYASGFLVEECALAWTTYRDRIGEGGVLIDLPAFQLDMTGAGFVSPVRRSGPSTVSESQREFIDLSFRMALIDVATANSGTIIIDAPESSLDAVFVGRAAEVLTRFAESAGDKRLLVTSNLIDGDLVPDLLARSGISSASSSRVVDLLQLAAPTAATTRMRDAYIEVRRRIFERATEKLRA